MPDKKVKPKDASANAPSPPTPADGAKMVHKS